jgi:hypothetical protein
VDALSLALGRLPVIVLAVNLNAAIKIESELIIVDVTAGRVAVGGRLFIEYGRS